MFVKLLLAIAFSAAAVKPTSKIPERREFPVNPKINPCEDFYEYTCSKAKEGFKLREDRSRHIFSFSDSDERILEKKESYLSNLDKQNVKTPGEVELNDVFKACMNTSQRAVDEVAEVTKVLSILTEIKTREQFQKFVGDSVLTKNYSFFDFGSIENQSKPDWLDIFILADIRGLPERSYYEDPKVIAAYEKLVEEFFKTLKVENAEKQANWVVNFEKDFDKNYPLPNEWREIWTKPSKISKKELLKKYKVFYLDSLLDKIPNRTLIRNFVPKSYDFMKKSLEGLPLEQLKAVYLYHSLVNILDTGYPKFYQKKFDFNKAYLGGPNKREVLKERCTKYVKRNFMKELDYELYPKIFGEFSKEKFVKLADKVRASLIKGLEKNTWLSKKGKKNAIKKMKKAYLQVVKPNNKEEWDFPYPADYSSTHYLENLKTRNKVNNQKTLDELSKKVNDKAWGLGPLMVNAYYSSTKNKFVMPAGILQYPFYDQNLPDHINLGAVGAVVGHELGHGIDDQGSKFDYKGRLKTWMSKEDLVEFKKRGKALVEQFNKVGHNGNLTLGENIGDLVGVTAAYNAAFPNGQGETKKKKEFFLQYGRAWCGEMRDGTRKLLLKTDSHALIEARVNQQVVHQDGFYEVFKCGPKDKMYLPKEKRINIW